MLIRVLVVGGWRDGERVKGRAYAFGGHGLIAGDVRAELAEVVALLASVGIGVA